MTNQPSQKKCAACKSGYGSGIAADLHSCTSKADEEWNELYAMVRDFTSVTPRTKSEVGRRIMALIITKRNATIDKVVEELRGMKIDIANILVGKDGTVDFEEGFNLALSDAENKIIKMKR